MVSVEQAKSWGIGPLMAQVVHTISTGMPALPLKMRSTRYPIRYYTKYANTDDLMNKCKVFSS